MTAKQKRTFSITGIATLILGGLIAWAVFTFTDFTAGRFVRPNTPAPSADAAARQFEGRTDLTNPAYLNKVAAAGIADAEKRGWVPSGVPDLNGGFTQTAPAPKPEAATPVAGEWPIKGKWTEQTPRGPLTIIYRETASARGKIKFWVDEKGNHQQNLLNRPLEITFFAKHNGRLISEKGTFAANEIDSEGPADGSIVGTLEIWYEVR